MTVSWDVAAAVAAERMADLRREAERAQPSPARRWRVRAPWARRPWARPWRTGVSPVVGACAPPAGRMD